MRSLKNTDRIFVAFWALAIGLRLAFIAIPDLKVEEAYHWNFSQHPSLSYFDHPPFIAWVIGLSSYIVPASEFWVRLPAILFFSATMLLWYRLCSRLFNAWVGLLAVLLLNTLPIFTIYSFFIMPDSFLTFFWSLGMWAGWRIWENGDSRWWWAIGVATGLGLDSKYPALVIPLGVVLFFIVQRRWDLILNRHFVGAAVLANILFLPVIVWNGQHHWASFLFQGTQRITEDSSVRDRLGSWLFQAAMMTPVGFLALPFVLRKGWTQRQSPPYSYLLCWTLPFLALMVAVSLRRQVLINWPLPGYIGATFLMAAVWVDFTLRRKSLGLAFALVFLITAIPLAWLPFFQALSPLPAINAGDDINDWRPMAEAALEVQRKMPHPKRTFLIGHGYQCASELAFYGGHPHETMANNVLGERAVSYDFWEKPSLFLGQDAVLVTYGTPRHNGTFRPRVWLDEERLHRCFERIDAPTFLDVDRGGKPLRHYEFYRCYNYLGPVTEDGKRSLRP